jgi:tetratricopeptide (TPR) repeat protein
MNPMHSERDPFEQLADAFLARYRAGERPSITAYAQQHPEFAEQIRDLLPALVAMEELRPGKAAAAAGPLTKDRPVPEQLGEYRILREVGHGGMGVVYEAVQESLGRHVALKVLPFHTLMHPTHLERFRREARAAAQLHHTNIVPVFGVGEHAGIHYYAMQFIQGQGLDVVLEEVKRLRDAPKKAPAAGDGQRGRPLAVSAAEGLLSGQFAAHPPDGQATALEGPARGDTPAGSAATAPTCDGHSELTNLTVAQYCRSVARLGVQVAEALAYAHQHGIVHRDIKPSNLLLDTRGTVWVTDFGLAKAEDSDELTSPGDVVGTLRYMAPERLHGESEPRGDVYSLGITLYELLTLEPAFGDVPRAVLMERVAHEEPPPPRQRERRIPPDMETIVLKAIAKEPARRYPSAGEMADDLRRFLADRPIQARRSSVWEQFWRWRRRNRAVASLLFALAALVLVIAVGVGWVARDQAVRESALVDEVNRGLDEASRRIDEGKWPEARTALQRTEELLIAAGRPEFPSRLLELQQDVAMARRLEDIYSQPVTHEFYTGREQDVKYAEAFQEYGIDLAVLPAEEAAERIRARSIRLELARALDFWSAMRRQAGKPGSPDWKPLLELAKMADPDSWRNRLRDSLVRDDREDLKGMAASADVRDLPPATLVLLGKTLGDHLESPEQAVALLRQAQRQYPADLWINDALGAYYTRLRPPQYDESARFYTTARAVRPDSPYLTHDIAWALYQKGSHAEAIAEFSRAIELKPDYRDAWYGRAAAYANLGQRDKAVADSSRAIELDPKLAAAWNLRGRTYGNLGECDKAVVDLSRAIELDGNFMEAWNNRGAAYVILGQSEKALPDLSRAIELDPNYAIAWVNRGQAYLKVGHSHKALADFSRAIELDPNWVQSWRDRGRAYANLGQWDKALADFSRIIDLDPKSALAYVNRGWAYGNLRQWDKALADFSTAMELDPKFALAYANRGWVYGNLRQWDKALADLSKAIELDPKRALAYANRGWVYRNLGQWDKALADSSRIIDLDPKSANAYLDRGWAYGNLRQWDKALADLYKAIELDPKCVLAWRNRGWTYANLCQWDKALADYSRAIELDPKSAAAYRDRGWAYGRVGQCDKALADLSKAMEFDPKFAEMWYNRSNTYAELGQWDKALADWSKAVGLDPEFTKSLNFRDYVYKLLTQWDRAAADVAPTGNGSPPGNETQFRIACLRLLQADTPAHQQLRKQFVERKQRAADFPTVPQYQYELAAILNNLGLVLQGAGRCGEAEAAHRDALAIWKSLAADFPTVPGYREELAGTLTYLALLLRQTDRAQGADANYRDALALRKQLAADFPTVPEYRQLLARTLTDFGLLLQATDRSQEAELAFGDALASRKQLATDFPSVPYYQNELAEAIAHMAGLARRRGDLAQARELLEQAHPYHQAALKPNARHPGYRRLLRNNWLALAQVLTDLGDHAAAVTAAGELCHVAYDPAKDAYGAAVVVAHCIGLAETDARLPEAKRKELAQSYGDQALAMLREAIAKGYNDSEQLKKAPEFEPLRARAEFQALLTTLADKSNKVAPK